MSLFLLAFCNVELLLHVLVCSFAGRISTEHGIELISTLDGHELSGYSVYQNGIAFETRLHNIDSDFE